MGYLIPKLSKSVYNESGLLFFVRHRFRLTSDLRVVQEVVILFLTSPRDDFSLVIEWSNDLVGKSVQKHPSSRGQTFKI